MIISHLFEIAALAPEYYLVVLSRVISIHGRLGTKGILSGVYYTDDFFYG